MHFCEESHLFTKQSTVYVHIMYIWLYSACRLDGKESEVGLDGSLVQHGAEYESKGVPAVLERLYELPEGKQFWVHHMKIYVHFIPMYFVTSQNYEFLGFAAEA